MPRWDVFAPVLFVTVGALVALLLDGAAAVRRRRGGGAGSPSRRGPLLAIVSSIALGGVLLSAWGSLTGAVEPVFDARTGLFLVDRLTSVGTLILASAALVTLWLSVTMLSASRLEQGSFHALVLLASAGMFIAIGAGHLAFLFVGLELASLCLALLAAYDTRRPASLEAGLKLHVTGGFASSLMLFGIALLYGATGELAYGALWAALDGTDWLGLAGLSLLLCGLFFKLALFPFHQWVSDVFEGAPAVASGFLAVAMPTTTVIVLLRLLDEAIPPDFAPVSTLLSVLGVANVIVGHGLALVARSVKRMLACAGLAHAGHLAIGLACSSTEAFEAVLFYVFVYAFIALGAHGLAASLAHGGREIEAIDDFAGLAKVRPVLALALSLFLLALAGLPGTGGFWAMYNLFSAAMAEGAVWSVAIALIGVGVSWRYLLAVPIVMFTRAAPSGGTTPLSTAEVVVLGVCTAVVVYLGWMPAPGLADVMSRLVH